MQVPISPDSTLERKYQEDSGFAPPQSGLGFPIESQIRLRALYEYLDACRATLHEIRQDLLLFESNPECSLYAKRAAELLENFCIEADSWGFNALYEIGLGLQVLLLNSSRRPQNGRFWEALYRGVETLLALLEQCESDFRWRLAVADVLDCVNQATHN
jgi:hypothetical protein